MPFLKALMPWAKSPISDEIFPRPPKRTITTNRTMIQCQILREPIGKSSARDGLFGSSRHDLTEKLGFAGGKNKDLGPVKGPRCAGISAIYLKKTASLLRARRRRCE